MLIKQYYVIIWFYFKKFVTMWCNKMTKWVKTMIISLFPNKKGFTKINHEINALFLYYCHTGFAETIVAVYITLTLRQYDSSTLCFVCVMSVTTYILPLHIFLSTLVNCYYQCLTVPKCVVAPKPQNSNSNRNDIIQYGNSKSVIISIIVSVLILFLLLWLLK